jgi:hypothetical protein
MRPKIFKVIQDECMEIGNSGGASVRERCNGTGPTRLPKLQVDHLDPLLCKRVLYVSNVAFGE